MFTYEIKECYAKADICMHLIHRDKQFATKWEARGPVWRELLDLTTSHSLIVSYNRHSTLVAVPFYVFFRTIGLAQGSKSLQPMWACGSPADAMK